VKKNSPFSPAGLLRCGSIKTRCYRGFCAEEFLRILFCDTAEKPEVLEVFYIATKELSVNEQIKAAQIRLIGSDGSQLGILKTRDALNMAYEKNLDLVEISPQGNPPVCKIMDYGKFKFEKDKKDKESRKKQTTVELKEIKFSCRIGQHDLETKLGHAYKFLSAGNKVKMTIMFSGREMNHTDLGYKLMEQIAESCSEYGSVEKKPSLDGRFMTMFIAPKAK